MGMAAYVCLILGIGHEVVAAYTLCEIMFNNANKGIIRNKKIEDYLVLTLQQNVVGA